MYEDVNFDDLFVPAMPNTMTVKLKELLPNFKDRPFTSNIVLAAMKRVGIEVGCSASVSGVLKKLTDEGFLKLVQKGGGGTSNIYQIVKNDN